MHIKQHLGISCAIFGVKGNFLEAAGWLCNYSDVWVVTEYFFELWQDGKNRLGGQSGINRKQFNAFYGF